jgi:hypothetical protein
MQSIEIKFPDLIAEKPNYAFELSFNTSSRAEFQGSRSLPAVVGC